MAESESRSIHLKEMSGVQACSSAISLLQALDGSVSLSSSPGNIGSIHPGKPDVTKNEMFGLAKAVQLEERNRNVRYSMVDGAKHTFSFENVSKQAPYGNLRQGSVLYKPSLETVSSALESKRMAAHHFVPVPRGALSNLRAEAVDTVASSGCVVLEVRAVGINFRDVLNVLGMYPGDPGPPGGDCSGVVVSCGSGVTSLRPGDAVFGLACGSLGSHVQVSAGRMACMPPNLSFESAATCPTVFITVDTAFRQAAGCVPGERVLVHGAAGGVGLAAIQQAAALGGVVVATAGGPNKRSLVRGMGVEHAFGSRDTQFVSEVAELGGVDIVLNSLTSSGFVSGSLSVLRRGGRFIEISKRDIWSGSRVSQERPDVGYTLVAVDFLPDMAVQRALVRLGGLLSEGVVNPLPQVTHRLGDVQAALRQMSQARHVGKIVTSAFESQLLSEKSSGSRMLVTGGLGTLGSLTCSWLLSSGRVGVIASGRTGRLRGGNDLLDAIRSCTLYPVELVMADASMEEDACGLFLGSPLSGMFHASGVLMDATLGNQSLSGIRQVFAPKVDAMERLAPRLYFQPGSISVLFSSVASLIGSAGQSNYSSANSWLDSLSAGMQAMGNYCLSIQWGAWSGSGMAGEAVAVKRAVERQNMRLIQPDAGLAALKNALVLHLGPVTGLIPFDWDRMRSMAERGSSIAPIFEELVGPIKPVRKDIKRGNELPAPSLVAPVVDTVDVKEAIRDVVCEVIGSSVGDDEPLMAAGLDSLASVEFKNALEAKFAISLPSTLIFDYPTIASIAGFLGLSMAGATEPSGLSHTFVASELQSCVSDIIGSVVENDQPLMAAGLDSLGAVELRNAIQRSLGVDIPSTFVFDYPTIDAMSGYLVEHGKVMKSSVVAPVEEVSIFKPRTIEFGDVKLLALSSRIPGGVPISTGIDASSSIPLNRWDLCHEERVLGEAPIRFSMFLDGVDMFDSTLFNISKNEASIIDPQHRNLLECSYEAMHSSASIPKRLVNSGVFVGIASTEYRVVVHDHLTGYSPLSATGTL